MLKQNLTNIKEESEDKALQAMLGKKMTFKNIEHASKMMQKIQQ